MKDVISEASDSAVSETICNIGHEMLFSMPINYPPATQKKFFMGGYILTFIGKNWKKNGLDLNNWMSIHLLIASIIDTTENFKVYWAF